MELKHTLLLKGEKYEISVNYARAMKVLPNIPDEIGIKLIKNKPYEVESQVSPEVFRNFLNYWVNTEDPEINSENIFEYYLLSQEFRIEINNISEESDEFHMSVLKYTSTHLNNQPFSILCKIKTEKHISEHLDYFLNHCENILLKAPINSLYNIFFHEERKLKNQQKAFEFIEKNKGQNPNLSILLPSLEAEKIDRDKIIEFLVSNDDYNFSPRFSPSFYNLYGTKNEKMLCKLIYKLASNKDMETLKFLFYDENFDPNMKIVNEDENKREEVTPLYFAFKYSEIDLAKYLLTKPGIDVNIKFVTNGVNRKGENTYELFVNEVEKLSYESLDGEEYTLLYLAVEQGNIEMVKLLLERPELDVNSKSVSNIYKYPITSIEPSASLLKMSKSFLKSPEEFFHSKEDINEAWQNGGYAEISALHLAIQKQNIEIIKLLLSHPKIDINIKFIHTEPKCRVEAESNCFLAYEQKEDKTPLHFAIESGNIEIIKLLLSRPELDINKLYTYSFEGNFSLLSIAFFVATDESSPVFGSLSELKMPLNKLSVKAVEYKKKSALHLAVESKIEIIKLLLTRSELDINAKALEERQWVCTLTESEQMELKEKAPKLLKSINDQLNRNENKRIKETALHTAVKKGDTEIIKLLLENNIDIESTNAEGKKSIELTDNQEIISILEKSKH